MMQVVCISKRELLNTGDGLTKSTTTTTTTLEKSVPKDIGSVQENHQRQPTPPRSPASTSNHDDHQHGSTQYITDGLDFLNNKDIESTPRSGRTESECFSSGDSSMKYASIGSSPRFLSRTMSSPQLHNENENMNVRCLFHDLSPRSLRLLEVQSWKCFWMSMDSEAISIAARNVFNKKSSLVKEELVEGKGPVSIMTPMVLSNDEMTTISSPKEEIRRPKLKLKLQNMPTTQQAEERAQRAALRVAHRRGSTGGTPALPQRSFLRLRLNSFSSGDEYEIQSPHSPESRASVGSQWSPNHGRFTTQNMCVSEAGISSPDAVYLHLQHDLARVKELGRGASGVVHKAIHVPTLKVVAVKDVPVYGKGHRRQMVRELNALYSNLVPIAGHFGKNTGSAETSTGEMRRPSPHIVSFYDAFVDKAKNCVCMVMEYMDMGSLQDLVLRGGCQSERVLARIANCVLQGLCHIHSNRMVHRDIKPHNLLMNRLGDVKISDFGLARTMNDNVHQTKTFVGTLLYMAPERIGGGDYSYGADIWSFGLSLMAVALGKYPLPTSDGFFGLVDSVGNEEYLSLPETFSKDFRDFMDSCLQIDPCNRPSASELLKHPFIAMDNFRDTLDEWKSFADASGLVEDPNQCLDALATAVYSHHFDNSIKFSFQTQSEYGSSLMSRFTAPIRRTIQLQPIEKSLQIGLAKTLDIPPDVVYSAFEKKREAYNLKLTEENCFSPSSWSSSPGYTSSNNFPIEEHRIRGELERHRHSVWRRLQDRVKRFGQKKSKPFVRGQHL